MIDAIKRRLGSVIEGARRAVDAVDDALCVLVSTLYRW